MGGSHLCYGNGGSLSTGAEIASENIERNDRKVWTVKRSLEWASRYLEKRGIENPCLNAELLLGHLLQKKRFDLCLVVNQDLSCSVRILFQNLVKKRSQRVPLSHLTGKQDFMGYSFKVDPRVYIPRPETEILVEKVLQAASLTRGRKFMAVDLGTGCGNIAITLAKQLQRSKIWAVDISPESLEVARDNARLHHVDKRVEFLRGDLFTPLTRLGLQRRVDLIISNPPYVASTQMRNLPPEVKKEPKVALEGGEDGLSIHRRIIRQAPRFLNKTGLLALEIGYGQAKIIKDLISAQPQFLPPKIVSDYQGKERVVLTRTIFLRSKFWFQQEVKERGLRHGLKFYGLS